MKASLLIGVLCILAVCYGIQDFSWTDAANPRTKNQGGTEFWGVSWDMVIAPDSNFLFDEHSTGAQNGNNTEYRIELKDADGIYRFTPDFIIFRLEYEDGASTPFTDDELIWTPASQIVTAVAVNMDAATRDPIWSFNFTAGLQLPTLLDTTLQVDFLCLDDAGDDCVGVETGQQNISFYSPNLRMSIFSVGLI